ncbi:hypothetical protein PG997_002368 [Apiospora hydei]|uniref:Uncharacterized protein n=1 Tax=Apiospora hydei TaxID=1337664 RepID=A0ABR1X977_9PEZI
MNDSLVSSGGTISLGCSPSVTTPTNGVSWSLSLAHLKYYGQPVQRKGVFRPDPTRISFNQLLFVVIGCILTRWHVSTDHDSTQEAIRLLSSVSEPFPHIPMEPFRAKDDTRRAYETDIADRKQGIRLISQAATMALKDQERSWKFINLGGNRSNFLPPLTRVNHIEWQNFLRPFFGLTNVVPLLECFRNADGRVEFLRRMANKAGGFQDRQCIIQYNYTDRYGSETVNYASVFPRTPVLRGDDERPVKKAAPPHSRWLHYQLPADTTIVGETIHINQDPIVYSLKLECTYLPGTEAEQAMELWFGDGDDAGIYVAIDSRSPTSQWPGRTTTTFPPPRVTQQDLLWCAEHGLLSVEKILLQTTDSITRTLQCLAVASNHAFGTILGPVIQIKTLESPLIHAKSMAFIGDQIKNAIPQISTFTQAISILVYMVAGHDMSHDEVPSNVIGISVGDSIFVPEQTGARNSFTRILGNIGRPGCVTFFSVENPITAPLDESFWRVADLQKFDGAATDLLHSTSMHLSFTNWERPLEGFRSGGHQDVEIALVESVLSIRERGQWIGDVDVLPALRSKIIYRLPPQHSCSHPRTEPPQAYMTSIESWDELREFSAGNVVVRANGNWLARLATTAYLAQSAERDRRNIGRITVCPSSVCWRCLDVSQFPANIYIY